MTQIKKDQLYNWEQLIQDAKMELDWATEEDWKEQIETAKDKLDLLEREIWEKRIEPDEPIQEATKKKQIKVNDYKEKEPYYIEI